MFDGIVPRYDLLNGILSLGQDDRWRQVAAAAVGAKPGQRVLDLGCGTGELGARLAGVARVVGVDVSGRMLGQAQARFGRRIALVRGSAFHLPFRDGVFSGAVSGFVLRNLNDLDGAFRELARVLAPGARIALVDATEPRNHMVRSLFDAYFGTVAPVLGTAVGQPRAYRYLVGSLAHLPPAEVLCRRIEQAGFTRARARPLTLGAVTLFTAVREELP